MRKVIASFIFSTIAIFIFHKNICVTLKALIAARSFNKPCIKDWKEIFSRTFSLTCFLWDRYGRCWLFNFFTREMMMLWCRDGRVCAVFCVEKCVLQVYAVLDVRWSLLLGFLLLQVRWSQLCCCPLGLVWKGEREFPFPEIPGNTSLKFPFPSRC